MAAFDMKGLVYGLKEYYDSAEQTEKIIIDSALVAAAADAVGGIIPGVAIPATIVACFGTVWVMYGRLCDTLGVSLKENVLKLLAKAALANISANLGAVLISSFIGMFIPGASILVSAAVAFVTVYLAGLIFLQMILKLAERSADPHTFSDISADSMEQTVKGVKLTKDDVIAAKAAYKRNKR